GISGPGGVGEPDRDEADSRKRDGDLPHERWHAADCPLKELHEGDDQDAEPEVAKNVFPAQPVLAPDYAPHPGEPEQRYTEVGIDARRESALGVIQDLQDPTEIPQRPVPEEVDPDDRVEQEKREQRAPDAESSEREVGILAQARDAVREKHYGGNPPKGRLPAGSDDGDEEGHEGIGPHRLHKEETGPRDRSTPGHTGAPAPARSS